MGLEVFSSVEWTWATVVAWAWALLAAPFVLVWFFYLRTEKQYKLPPGPPRWPIVGNLGVLLDTKKPLHQAIDDLSKVYGPLLMLKVGKQNMVFVSDSELTMQFCKSQDHLFSYRPDTLLAGKYLVYGDSHLTLGQPGDYHSFLRRFLVSELLSNKKLQGFKGTRTEEQNSITRAIYLASQRKESIDVRELFNILTLNVITRMGFGKRFFGADVKHDGKLKSQQAWVSIVPEMTTKFTTFLAESIHPSLYWVDTLTGARRGMQSCQSRLDALCQELVDEHKQRLDALTPKELEEYIPMDFMDLLLLQRGSDNAKYITDRNLKAISMDLIVAGSDTSSTAMEWIMAELIAQPHLMKRVQEELDSVVGLDRCVDESDIPNLPFLHAVIKETFRLHPPLPWLLPHSNRVDCKVAGYDIPKGSFINLNVYGMSRSALYWEDPLRFNPDRFFKTGGGIEAKGTHAQLMPFGTGRRICPGMYMTYATVNSTLARMLHCFDWSMESKNGDSQIDMRERSGAVAAKLVPLKALPSARLPAHLFNEMLST